MLDNLLIDGAPATAAQLAHQALVNYGAYTSFHVQDGSARGLDLHLARLDASAIELFGEPVGEDRLRDLMRQAVFGRSDCWLRVSLFSSGIGHRTPTWSGAPSVMTAVLPTPAPLPDRMRLQVRVHPRHAPHLKHSGTIDLIAARRAAMQAGYDDVLFASNDGFICEGSLWSVGFVWGSEVVWPTGLRLDGITQTLIDQGLAAEGLRSSTRAIHFADLDEFQGVFVCSSSTPAASIAAIDGREYRDAPVQRLRAAWARAPLQPI